MLPNPERAAHVSRAAEEELIAAIEVRFTCIRAEITFNIEIFQIVVTIKQIDPYQMAACARAFSATSSDFPAAAEMTACTA